MEQLWLCMNWAKAPHRALPFPLSPALGQPRASPSSIPAAHPAPRAPPCVQVWDVRRVLSGSSALSPREGALPQPQGSASAGPGGDNGSPDTTARDPPGTLQGPSSASFLPASAPREERHHRQSPGTAPLPPGTLPGKLPAFLCLWICTSRFPVLVQTPPCTNPGQVVGVRSALSYPCPSKGMVGWNWDGQQRIAGLGNFCYHEMAILYVMRCVL